MIPHDFEIRFTENGGKAFDKWGANAIINFEAIEHPVQVPMPSGVMKEMDVGIKLSGFAIKRK